MSLTVLVGARRASSWLAYASAACWIVGNVAALLFYALELPTSLADGMKPQVFGPLSDYASLFQFVFLLPLPLILRQVSSSGQRGPAAVAALGVSGALLGAIAQTLLVTGVVAFEMNLPLVVAALVLIGGWMFLANRRGRSEGFLSARLALLGAFAGATFALVMSLTLAVLLAAALNPRAIANPGAFTQGAPALIVIAIVTIIPAALACFFLVPIWLIGLGRQLYTAPGGVGHSDWRRTPVTLADVA